MLLSWLASGLTGTFSVCSTCSLQDVLRSEASLITGFQSLRIPTLHRQSLLRLSGRSENVAFGLDIRNESVIVSQKLSHVPCGCFDEFVSQFSL